MKKILDLRNHELTDFLEIKETKNSFLEYVGAVAIVSTIIFVLLMVATQ